MAEKVPRRLMRFQRNTAQTQPVKEKQEADDGVVEENEQKVASPTGRVILESIPSMKYEDLEAAAKKKYSELKNAKNKSTAEQMTLKEMEKFKKANNRLPSKEESEKIADNLYSQLKNVNTSELYGLEKKSGEGRRNSKERGVRERNKRRNKSLVEEAQKGRVQESGDVTDIKALLSEESEGTGTTSESNEEEFDIGLEEEGNEKSGDEELEPLEEESGEIGADSKNCPNCKRKTDKIIYCPKCGTAFCNKCTKSDATNFTCPKCGAKIKK